MDSRDRAAILLAGLPKLNATLNLGVHEPLRQRIVMNYNLEGMSKDEGRYYISEKLKGAGCNQTIFEDAAIEAILNAADGTQPDSQEGHDCRLNFHRSTIFYQE